jgi:UDP-N-acetylglucosamine--N-acetylmuramyl-(pentapeptide) pyrophosphoryl-undecaprenol N-acetylglucosamine transferase
MSAGALRLRAVLAGGGTGGHVIPALAIADEIARRGGEVRFVGTADRLEARLVPAAGFGIDFIKVRPLAGGGVLKRMAGLASAPFAVGRSAALLGRLAPNVVLGVGGYVAGPVVLAAWLRGIPTAFLEQNATLGLANRLNARLVRRAFLSYREAGESIAEARVRLTGNPVKQAIIDAAGRPAERAADGTVRLLVMGGSQGALAIDERVPAAVAAASFRVPIRVTHQCGGGRESEVAEVYRAAGIEAQVVGFIDDTASAYQQTDLVIARAGATTIAELTVMGLPAVLLPYPHHADRQQHRNAAPLVEAGAAVVLDEPTTGVADLSAEIERFVNDSEQRATAARAARELGRPDAASAIVDGLAEIAGGAR